MESSAVQVKPEPSSLRRDSSASLCIFRDHSKASPSFCSDSNEVSLRVAQTCAVDADDCKLSLALGFSGHEVCNLPTAGDVDFFSSESTKQPSRDAPLDSLVNLPCISTSSLSSSSVEHGSKTGNFSHAFTCGRDAHYEAPDSTEMSAIKVSQSSFTKPSEALFVRALIGRCKRIAPLWFRGVSSMRERNREENRRMANNNGQTQSDWSLIGLKIAEMDTAAETEAVANLLKKLYKELPADSVFWFLKCWLCSEDSVNDPDSCVISRGDAKGRMRRIDGGKGSDKVWRLDTIVGMLYHGLPMSSTDTNIMVHTCDQELCVRPQHIRFRASSVALVVVLKALAQGGYTVLPPKVPASLNGVAPCASDESVDVFGPFTIDELQRYRSENLLPSDDCSGKLSLSDTDREFAESVPVLRAALMSACETQPSTVVSRSFLPHIPHINGYHPYSTTFKPEAFHSVSSDFLPTGTVTVALQSPQSLTMLARPSAPSYLGTKQAAFVDSPADVKPPPNNLISVTKPSVLTTGTRPHHSDRRSLKRAAPTDSCSFRSSPHQPSSPPDSVQSHSLSHSTCYRRQRLSGPSLPTIVAPTVLSGFLSGDLPVSSNVPSSTCAGSSSCVSTAVALSSTSVSSQLPNAFTVSSTELHSVDLCSTQQPFPTHSILRGFQPNMYIPGTLPSYHNSSAVVHQPYPLHQPSAPPHPHPGQGGPGPISGPYLTQLAAHGTNGQTAFTLSSGSNSGKTTPRQPAKKRLEARTPTIDGAGDDSGALATGSHSNTPSLDDSTSMVSTICSGPSSMAFRVHQNTPFVPVQSRSGRPSSSGSSSSASGFQLAPAASTAGVSPSVGGLLRKTSHFGASDGEAALPAATRASIASTAQSDEEEEELVGIMVGRSVDSVLHSSSDTTTSTGDRKRCATLQSGNQPLGTIGTFSITKNPTSLMSSTSFPEVGRSPMCERHVIEMIGALLANSAASPSFRRSSQSNSRRSASASSLPYVGTSPNENLPHLTNSVGLAHPFASISNTRSSPSYICSPAQSVSGKFPLSVHPEANAVSNECDDRSSLFGSSVKSRALHQHNLHSSTPPPRLTPMSDLDGMRLPDDPHPVSRLPALQPLQLNGESNPSQEIVNFIRNSPASGITPELIDMLYNMAQQYGVHQPRAGSRASRSSSQVAQNFYRSLINGSVCSSPFPANANNFGSLSNTLNVSNTACQTDCVPVSSATPAGSSLLSPASCSVFSSTPPMHHLRGLSFTPLSVDPDQTNCSSTSNVDWADPVSAAQSAPPVSVMQLPHYPSRAVTHSCGVNQPRGPPPSHTTSSDEGPCRRSVKH